MKARTLRAVGTGSMIVGILLCALFVGACVYDSWFNPAYLYGSAPLWLYIAVELVSYGIPAAACFIGAAFCKRAAKRRESEE